MQRAQIVKVKVTLKRKLQNRRVKLPAGIAFDDITLSLNGKTQLEASFNRKAKFTSSKLGFDNDVIFQHYELTSVTVLQELGLTAYFVGSEFQDMGTTEPAKEQEAFCEAEETFEEEETFDEEEETFDEEL